MQEIAEEAVAGTVTATPRVAPAEVVAVGPPPPPPVGDVGPVPLPLCRRGRSPRSSPVTTPVTVVAVAPTRSRRVLPSEETATLVTRGLPVTETTRGPFLGVTLSPPMSAWRSFRTSDKTTGPSRPRTTSQIVWGPRPSPPVSLVLRSGPRCRRRRRRWWGSRGRRRRRRDGRPGRRSNNAVR